MGTSGPLRDIRDVANARQILRALSQSRMDEQFAEIQALESRFKGTRIVHALTDSLVRDEWSDLVLAGHGIRFYANQAAVAAQSGIVEVGNGLVIGLPTSKALLIKRIICNNGGGPATQYATALDSNYAVGTVVAPSLIRYFDSSIEDIKDLGTMPRYFVGGNSGANAKQGSAVNPLVTGAQNNLRAAVAADEKVFEVPGGWFQVLLDRNPVAGNPFVLRIWNTTLNQQFNCMIECAEVPLDYF